MRRARWPALGLNNPSSEASVQGGFVRGLEAALILARRRI